MKKKKHNSDTLKSMRDIRRWIERGGILKFTTASMTYTVGVDVTWDASAGDAVLEVKQYDIAAKRDTLVASCHVSVPTTVKYMESVAEEMKRQLNKEAMQDAQAAVN